MVQHDDDCVSECSDGVGHLLSAEIDRLPSEERVEDVTNIATFPAVRDQKKWRGQARKRVGYKRGGDGMFLHTFRPIKQSMTKLPQQLDTKAQYAFTLVQHYMYDSAEVNVSRLDALRMIIDMAATCPPMGLELYVQVMKQLTQTPSSQSASAGYRIMLGLVQNAPLSYGFGSYLEHFFKEKFREVQHDDHTIVQLCFERVYSQVASAVNGKNYCVDVAFMDDSILKVHVDLMTTAKDLQEEVISTLGLNKDLHWCIAQATSHSEVTKVIHGSSAVVPLISQWNSSVAAGTGKKSWLVFKRLLQSHSEGLDPLHHLDTKLSFEQARREYLLQPLPELQNNAVIIASRLVFHMSSRAHALGTKESELEGAPVDVSNAGALECLLPLVSIKLENRKRWSKYITSAIEGKHFCGRDLMYECYSLLQKTTFFGTSWFSVQETSVDATFTYLEGEACCCEKIVGLAMVHADWVPMNICNQGANKDKVCYLALSVESIRFISDTGSAENKQSCKTFSWTELAGVSARKQLVSIFFKSAKHGRCVAQLIAPDAIGIAYEIEWLSKLIDERKDSEGAASV